MCKNIQVHSGAMKTFFVLLLSIPITTVCCNPVTMQLRKYTYDKDTLDYLESYGYLQKKHTFINYLSTEVGKAIIRYQSFMGLPSNGVIDAATKTLMKRPRCGELDISKPNKVQKLLDLKHKNEILYSVQSWATTFNRTRQNLTIWKAIDVWSAQTTANLTWSSSSGDVDIYFTTDLVNKNGILLKSSPVATKILKSISRYIIFINDNTTYSLEDIEYTCAHAFGHILGLSHQSSPSLMSPLFSSPAAATSDNCAITIKSASSYMQDGNTYFFKDSKFWKLSDKYIIDTGYPKNISTRWKGLLSDFDEGFVWGSNWYTYFFAKDKYYRYDSVLDKIDSSYPVLISHGWPGIPNNIDAAFTDKYIVTYFLKGDKVYRYDNKADRVANGYPKLIKTVFPSLPNDIDTAFRYYYDNELYFFKGLHYFKWNENFNQVDGPYVIKDGWKNLCDV